MTRRTSVFLGAAVLAVLAGPSLPSVGSPGLDTGRVRARSGQLARLVAGFVATIPARGSAGYDEPTRAEAAGMADAFEAMTAGDLDLAAGLAHRYRYSVVRFTDRPSGRRLLVLLERPLADGTWAHAWGLYVHDPRSGSVMTVEVTHPVADVGTERLGLDAFSISSARNLFVAGAHRDAGRNGSADAAHSEGSVFHAIHERAISAGDLVYQPHGFDGAAHPGYGDLVVSSGEPTPSTDVSRVARALSERFVVCTYDGESCSDLAATTNVQGASTRSAGARFLHLEVERALRDDRRALGSIAAVIRALDR